jgi:hypothetical protein
VVLLVLGDRARSIRGHTTPLLDLAERWLFYKERARQARMVRRFAPIRRQRCASVGTP